VESSYEIEIPNSGHRSQFDCRRLRATRESASHVAGNAPCDRHADTTVIIDIADEPGRHAQHDESSVTTPDAGFTALA
jgi:hypothetical protein